MQELAQQLRLAASLADIAGRITALRDSSPNETKTRYTIIDPILCALGWDTTNPKLVAPEYSTLASTPVDYALLGEDGDPVVFLEAKSLNSTLASDKPAAQIIGYASPNGVEHCVLTNGCIWRIYNTLWAGPAPSKLVSELRLDSAGNTVGGLLSLAQELSVLHRDRFVNDETDVALEEDDEVDVTPVRGSDPLERWGNVPESVRALYMELYEYCIGLSDKLEFHPVKRGDTFRIKGTRFRVCILVPRQEHVFLWTVCRTPIAESLPEFARRYPETAEAPRAIRLFVSDRNQLPYAKHRLKFAFERVMSDAQ